MSFKPIEVTPVGNDVTMEKTPDPMLCMMCQKVCQSLVSCEKCSCGRYCSVECMSKHENHTAYCPVICSLEKHEIEKRIATEIFSIDTEKLPYKMKMKLIGLVGERPVVDIMLNNTWVKGLWDTGAMVSVINEVYLKEQFGDVEIRPVEEIIGNQNLSVKVANQGSLSIKGVAILDFGVNKDEPLFQVPILVTEETLSNTIIGYNIIEYLVRNFSEKMDVESSLTKVIVGLSHQDAESMVNL